MPIALPRRRIARRAIAVAKTNQKKLTSEKHVEVRRNEELVFYGNFIR